MEKKSLYIGIATIALFWIPGGPLLILAAIWGIIMSREPYAYKADLALALNITGLILVVTNTLLGNFVITLVILLFGG